VELTDLGLCRNPSWTYYAPLARDLLLEKNKIIGGKNILEARV
jgi:hypothetical protein